MAYGKLKADTLVYDNSGSDVEVTISSLGSKAPAASPTFTGNVDLTGAVLTGASPLVLEGATANAHETTIAVTDPTADRTITLPDASGTVAFTASPTFTGDVNMTGAVLTGASPLVFEGATSDGYETTFAITDPTADRTITFPDASGTVAYLAAPAFTGTATGVNLTLSGNLTVNGTTTTVNTSTMTVTDKNIEIAKGSANDAAANGAGITVDSGDGDKTWNWVDATDSWTSSEHIDLANGKKIKHNTADLLSSTTLGSTVVNSSLTSVGTLAGLDTAGFLREAVTVTAGKLSDNLNLDLANGNVFLFTTAESTTALPNIRYNSGTTLNDSMGVGDVASVTIVTTANASGFSAQLTIDGNAVTENWIGGSAPDGGGSSGVDIHAYTIIKTAANTYTVIANHSKTS